ncbi:MAG TPA: MFS transporter [Bacteroidetes bacterium]|nr:MFS transporter [Bacteroidota bacterium]
MDHDSLKKAALLVATFASFLTPFMGSALNVALPSIGAEFRTDAITLNWIASSYLLSTAVFLLPSGRMADIIGRRKVFTTGILLFMAGSALAAISGNVGFLLFSRIIQGIGSALIFGTGVAIISSVFPPGERGKALGINVAAVYVGLSVGPSAGGILTQYWGWRSIFWITLPLGALALYLIFSRLKAEWAESKGERFDWWGFLLYGAALVMLMYGFSILPGWTGYVFFGGSILLIILFIHLQRKLVYPLFDTGLFRRNRTFAFSNLAALINYSATFGVGFLLSLYLQYIKNLQPREAGLVLLAQPLIMAVVSPLSGRLSDKLEPRIVATTGMGLSSLGLLLLVFLNEASTLFSVVAILMLLGLGFGFFSSPNTNAIMSSVNKKHYGVASGSVGTMRMVGQMFSLGIVMMIFSVFIGRAEINPVNYPAFLQSMKISFSVFSVLCFAGIFASLARGNLRK